MSEDGVMQKPGRREFLRSAPVAAAAGLMLAEASLLKAEALAAAQGSTQASAPVSGQAATTYKYFPAQIIESDFAALEAEPGSKVLVNTDVIGAVVELMVEKRTGQAEFEWHETRDHLIQVLEGAVVYEVGGTPKNSRNISQGQWRATRVEGSTTVTVGKGDILVLPRNTVHRRSTPESAKFIMVSPAGVNPG